jgi:threonine dehydrogenase-like Zn-dependent dehydrogenase
MSSSRLADLTGRPRRDLTIETTGVLKQLEHSVHMTRFGGKVLMFGIYTAKEGALPFYDLYFKEVSLISARGREARGLHRRASRSSSAVR